MKPKELFEVAVRVAGVFALLWGIWDLANSVLFYADYWRNPDMSFRFYLIFGWVSLTVGLILIRAPWVLVNFAYPPEELPEVTGEKAPDEDISNPNT